MSKIDKLYYDSGELQGVTYRNDSGEYHREGGPAFISYYKDGSVECEVYWLNGGRHRTDGPAAISYNEDGSISVEEYFINSRRHREDGSAYIS